jgi:tetratricopeptide (TPR) repeat protein
VIRRRRGLALVLGVFLLLLPCLLPPPSAALESAGASRAGFERALAASREGRLDEALDLWSRVLEGSPGDAAAWSNRGNVRLMLGDPQGAIEDQNQAMAIEPNHLDPHLNRGTAEEALGLWEAAAADYRWILAREPLETAALYNLGNVRGSLGDWETARACFQAAAEARPGMAMARSSEALAAFQLGDAAAAEHDLRSLIRRHPLFADARAALTAVLWQSGSKGEAESHWAAASGLDPRYRQKEWLREIRRWPPRAVQALSDFLSLAA